MYAMSSAHKKKRSSSKRKLLSLQEPRRIMSGTHSGTQPGREGRFVASFLTRGEDGRGARGRMKSRPRRRRVEQTDDWEQIELL
jgi:hypothetical protein